MADSDTKWKETYRDAFPLYERLSGEVRDILERELPPEQHKLSYSHRTKSIASLEEKISRKDYKAPLDDATDLSGVRVVTYYTDQIRTVGEAIQKLFDVHEHTNKSEELGVNKMGYNGESYVITLGGRYSGGRYVGIGGLKCEIQVRTVVQDAWAMISHHLVYKDERSTPQRLQRSLNKVATLLEIGQDVFDNVREERERYLIEIQAKEQSPTTFLEQPVDIDTLLAYTRWKFPNLQVSEKISMLLLRDLDQASYRTLADIDRAVELAKPAVAAYKPENPDWFSTGTDFITKSLGFVDLKFRSRHPFGQRTRDAFKKHSRLVSTS